MKQLETFIKKENVNRVFDLPCLDSRKSFYGKATILETNSGAYLKSYDTIVCFYSNNGEFVKLWDGYSATTMRHVNSFIQLFNIAGGGKAWWDALTV